VEKDDDRAVFRPSGDGVQADACFLEKEGFHGSISGAQSTL
jgi:hypothetical protein